MRILSVALLASLALASVGQGGTGHDKPPDTARFVLGINQDESLTLDGKAVTRDQLAKEWPRLADRVREKAKAVGEAVNPKRGFPAGIMIWAADETPYSLVSALLLEAQESGFQKPGFAPKSLHPDPSRLPAPGCPVVRAEPSMLLLDRTIPIRLRADGQGRIGRVTIGESEVKGLEALRLEVSGFQDDPTLPFDRALLRIDSDLIFSEFVQVTGLLAKFGITAIDLIEIKPGAAVSREALREIASDLSLIRDSLDRDLRRPENGRLDARQDGAKAGDLTEEPVRADLKRRRRDFDRVEEQLKRLQRLIDSAPMVSLPNRPKASPVAVSVHGLKPHYDLDNDPMVVTLDVKNVSNATIYVDNVRLPWNTSNSLILDFGGGRRGLININPMACFLPFELRKLNPGEVTSGKINLNDVITRASDATSMGESDLVLSVCISHWVNGDLDLDSMKHEEVRIGTSRVSWQKSGRDKGHNKEE